ncbi:MAG TPA: IS4 family transposase [Anaerolineae bacterium]|nr:IS4 family transposase [Anaerolineae bacterium]HPL29693.1 IS4 family transposase [Anaerolineae bacterium]
MGFRIRQIEAESKFSSQLSLQAISRAVPPEAIEAVLAEHDAKEHRERKLNAFATVLLVVAMSIFAHLSTAHVLKKIAQGLRYVYADPEVKVAGKAAISYRRYQLGARPLAALFRRVCRPLATPETPGAYLFGRRLMAIDGTIEDVPDTAENAAAFGRLHSHRGPAAFPQVRAVYLAECGTHAIVDAGFWPVHTGERKGAERMLRSVEPGTLLMIDAGLYEYDLVQATVQNESDLLGRLPGHVRPKLVQSLADGTYLAYIYPSEYRRRRDGEHLLVRVIEYTFDDPGRPGHGERHRLVTTLLAPQAYPARELICAYHERWEIEITIDEIDTHQRLLDRPLRSQRPVGVIQELYGLLIAHYAIRFLMHEAALQAGVDPDRISFTHALRVLQDAVPEFEMTAPEQLACLYARLLSDIADELLPARRNRINPRVVRRKMSNFKLKRPEHYHWPQPARPFRQAVVLI